MPKAVKKLNRNAKIYKQIIKAIQDKKGQHIVSLDLRNIPEAVADFFIVCTADNFIQIKAIADYIEHHIKEICDEIPFKQEGQKNSQWVLIDYINIVVHVMHPQSRSFYNLEDLWSDAEIVPHGE